MYHLVAVSTQFDKEPITYPNLSYLLQIVESCTVNVSKLHWGITSFCKKEDVWTRSTSDLDESKLKERLLEGVYEANSKFEGYQKSMRILLVDITFCIGRDFSYFSIWEVPDQQLNVEIEKTYPRVDCVYLCKTTLAWRGTGEPIPAHGYQAGIERGRIVSGQRSGLPQYQEVGYWEHPRPMYCRK